MGKKRHRIRSVAGIEDLAGYLLANVTSEYSLNRLAEVTQVRSVHTVQKYLAHLCEAFLFFSLRRYSVKFREQARANRKIYCIDLVILTAKTEGEEQVEWYGTRKTIRLLPMSGWMT